MTKKINKEEIIDIALDRFRAARDSDIKERKEAMDDIEFVVNEDNYQWPATVREQRENDNPPRPCLSLNKLPEKIDQVEGEFRQLRPSVKIRGVDSQADPKIAGILGGIIRHVEYNSNARSAYNMSHNSVLHCGRGAWRIDIEDSEEDPFVRDIVINRVPNPFTVYWDPGANKQDKSDANYMFVTEEIPEKEFQKQYPRVELSEWDHDTETAQGWRTDETIRIAEYWWKEKEKRTFYRVQRTVNGIPSIMTIPAEKAGIEDEVVEVKEVDQPQVKWCKMIYSEVIDGPHDWPSKYIPIIVEIGKENNIRGQSKTRGMVRHAKTPQRMYNFWSSSVTEQIALAPKSPYLTTARMIGKYQTQWDQANIKNFPYLLFDADPDGPSLAPRRESPPQLSTAVASELMRMEHDIMSAMGIYQASIGDEGEERSGRAILARQKQGSIGSYSYTDNFHSALIYSTKVILDLISYVYDTERIIRIRGEDGTEQAIPINARPDTGVMQEAGEVPEDLLSAPRPGITDYVNDLTIGKYDVVISIGPSYDTQRQEALNMMLELLRSIPQLGPATIDLIVQNIDLPGAAELVKRAKKLVPVGIRDLEPGEEPPEPQGPTHEQMIELKELQLKALEQMRKSFEAKTDAIAKLTKAEAGERGKQLDEIKLFVQSLQQEKQQPKPGERGQT